MRTKFQFAREIAPWLALNKLNLALSAVVLMLYSAVYIANAGPLYYFDTVGYYLKGQKIVDTVEGIISPENQTERKRQSQDAAESKLATVDRSAFYSILIYVFGYTVGLDFIVIIQFTGLALSVFLLVQISRRAISNPPSKWLTLNLVLLAAGLGAAPFFTAFLMPDIFAAILILTGVTLIVFAPIMARWEIVACGAITGTAALMHASHLALLALLIPLALFSGLVLRQRPWWLSTAAMSAVFVIAALGWTGYVASASKVAEKQNRTVATLPFLTARSIVDGPGATFLKHSCPESGFAMCELRDRLVAPESGDFIFNNNPERGVYALAPPELQARIAAEDRRFFMSVLLAHPFQQILASLANTFRQAVLFSPEMTLPRAGVQKMFENLAAEGNSIQPLLNLTERSILDETQPWVAAVSHIHAVIYALSFMGIIVMLVIGRNVLPPAVRYLAFAICMAILANAFVCGAVSQPASRYGARVIFALPVILCLMALYIRPRLFDAKLSGKRPFASENLSGRSNTE